MEFSAKENFLTLWGTEFFAALNILEIPKTLSIHRSQILYTN